MSDRVVIYAADQLSIFEEPLKNGPIKIDWSYFKRRSNPQNSLFHMWCSELAKQFKAAGEDCFPSGDAMTAGNMKEHLKHTFLGSKPVQKVDVQTGEITILHETRQSSKLAKPEMLHFLDQVREWAINAKLKVTIPFGSDYYEYLQDTGEAG
jgi:hypothetical protein